MDLELELDDDLIELITRVSRTRGMTPEEWARLALRVYLGLATVEEQRRMGQRIRRIEPL